MTFKEQLRKRELLVGSWLQSGSARIASVMAASGLDWLAIDQEHATIGDEALPAMIDAIKASGALPLVRTRDASDMAIRIALDAGAGGVIVPRVSNAEMAAAVVAAACYPPAGRRGIGFCHANRYGLAFDDYFSSWNQSGIVIVQIEDIAGLEAADKILAIPEVDGYLVGPYDLTGSMGILGQFEHPRLLEALTHLRHCAERHGKAAGFHQVQPSPAKLRELADGGYNFLAYGIDTLILHEHLCQALPIPCR